MKIQALNNQYQYKHNKLNNQTVPPTDSQLDSNNQIAFEGLKGISDKIGDKVGELYGKYYATPMLNQKWLRNFSNKYSGTAELMTQHMATLGSFLTSSVYFARTVTNKDLDPEKRTTLGINQIGCFVAPTICAYLADHALRGFNKKMEYAYSGYKRHQLATGQISGEKAQKLIDSFGTKLKGFRAFMGLLTFTLIYRYATPVLITPIANVIGDWWNDRKAAKKKAKEANQVNQVKEIALQPANEKDEKISSAA